VIPGVVAIVHRRAPRSAPLETRHVQRMAERMLRALALHDAELSVLLTDDACIRTLNRTHRKKDKPTDVLAFPMEAPDAPEIPGVPRLLGDVVISLDTAGRQARALRRALTDEVAHLLAHGLLHLVGYDHQTDAEEREMKAETDRLVAASGTRKQRKIT
jgi:probable rRNA maturation factor